MLIKKNRLEAVPDRIFSKTDPFSGLIRSPFKRIEAVKLANIEYLTQIIPNEVLGVRG